MILIFLLSKIIIKFKIVIYKILSNLLYIRNLELKDSIKAVLLLSLLMDLLYFFKEKIPTMKSLKERV